MCRCLNVSLLQFSFDFQKIILKKVYVAKRIAEKSIARKRKTVIYKIVYDDASVKEIYVGHTTDIAKCRYNHKSKYTVRPLKIRVSNRNLYVTI